MLTILYGHVNCELTGTKLELKVADGLLDEVHSLTFWVDGFLFAPSYQGGFWDGRVHLYNKKARTFPTGLLFKVLNILKHAGLKADVEGYPEPLEPTFDSVELLGGITLRDYQLDPIKKILKYHRGIWEVATNGGKTETAAGLLKVLGMPPCIFMIPRRVLLKQTAERLKERLGVPICMMGAGKSEFNPHGINVCMFQTLHRKLKNKAFRKSVEGIRVLFADECHMLLADSYQGCFEKIPAEFRVGMSGTPFQKDELKKHQLLGVVGPVVSKVENAELMSQGFSVTPSVAFLDLNVEVDRSDTATYGNKDYRGAIESHKLRNEVIAKISQGLVDSGRQTVVMVNTIWHGETLAKLMPNAMFVHGSMTAERKTALDRLASGEVFCLIATAIFDTGLSVDHIEGLVFAGGGESHIKTLQSIGRAIRVSKTKQKDVWVIDFVDRHNKILAAHARKRNKTCVGQKAFNMVYEVAKIPGEITKHLNGTELLPSTKFRK